MLWRLTRGQAPVFLAGCALIVVGIVCLYLSDAVVSGWWQGTLDAFGVGFIVGGVVDVLAISGLNQAIKAEDQRLLDLQREMDSILALRRAAMKQQGRLLEGEQAAEWARSFLNSHGSTINPMLASQLYGIAYLWPPAATPDQGDAPPAPGNP